MKVRTKEEIVAIRARAENEMIELLDEMVDCAEYWIAKCEHLEAENNRLARLSHG
jgi:hypothetical protein